MGAGPEWVHTNKRGATANSISAEVALCSGPPAGTSSVGISNPASIATSDEDMSNRLP
jgi:hypothetical protein